MRKIVTCILSAILVFVLFLNFTAQIVSFKMVKNERAGVCCCGESCDCGCGGMCTVNKEISVEICISSAPCYPLYKVNFDYPVKEALIQSFNFYFTSFPPLEFLKPSDESRLEVSCFEIFHPPDVF